MFYIVDIWVPNLSQEFRNIIHKDFREGYKHFLNVRVETENEEQAIEQALKTAYKELPEGDKSNICKADLMYNKVQLFSEYDRQTFTGAMSGL